MFYNPLEQLFALIGGIIQLFFWGGIMVVIIWAVKAASRNAANEDETMERWTAFLPNQAKSSKGFLDLVESELDIRGCPYEISRITINPVSAPREFVKVRFNYAYSSYIGYEIIGKDIQFNWITREKISWIYRTPIIGPILQRMFLVTSFVDKNKVIAFAAFTKDCAEKVIDSIMIKEKIDKNQLTKTMSGRLGRL